MRAENLTGPISHHAEGPVWSEEWGGLRWVDMLHGRLRTWKSGSVSTIAVGDPIAAFVRPRAGGGYVVATERGLALADEAHQPPSRRIELWDNSGVRMNDGGVTPDGKLLAGSMAYDAAPGRGRLYVVESDLSARVLLSGVTVSNGVAFSPDGSLMYYVDSLTHSVQVFDYSPGEVHDPRTLVQIDPGDGLPDGLTVASDGSVWVALWGGAAVHAYNPAGVLEAQVELPVSQVSACTFGGPELESLFITTSRQDLGEYDEPDAGSVFVVDPGVTGIPCKRFDG